jgi:hypothetical protein
VNYRCCNNELWNVNRDGAYEGQVLVCPDCDSKCRLTKHKEKRGSLHEFNNHDEYRKWQKENKLNQMRQMYWNDGKLCVVAEMVTP